MVKVDDDGGGDDANGYHVQAFDQSIERGNIQQRSSFNATSLFSRGNHLSDSLINIHVHCAFVYIHTVDERRKASSWTSFVRSLLRVISHRWPCSTGNAHGCSLAHHAILYTIEARSQPCTPAETTKTVRETHVLLLLFLHLLIDTESPRQVTL